jgi:hypothetical protein
MLFPMKTTPAAPLAAACLTLLPLLTAGQAAETKKFKVIDAFNSIDPKTVQLIDILAKPISTPDPAHKKALELVADFAKPDSYPRLEKKLPPNFISSKKFSGIRLWYRSNSETSCAISLAGAPRKDGRPTDFNLHLKGSAEWQEARIDFSQFKNYEVKVWDKATNTQKLFPGGETPKDEDFELINRVSIVTHVTLRGTAVKSHFMIDDLSLIEK